MQRNEKVNFYGGCRSVEDFVKLHEIGEGAYGYVYKAKDNTSGEIVALKQIKMTTEGDGMPVTAVREIQLLKAVSHHPNIVSLREVVVGQRLTSVFLVFEYCQHDLSCLLDRSGKDGAGRPRARFTESQVKKLTLQLLSALKFLHDRHIIHRDLKLSNLLYTNSGELKLADFGLARRQNTCDRCMTPKVVTLWYRPPELLLGQRDYNGYAVDMWAIGCILGELLMNQPLMPGDDELDQLQQMVALLGLPPPSVVDRFRLLPKANLLSSLGIPNRTPTRPRAGPQPLSRPPPSARSGRPMGAPIGPMGPRGPMGPMGPRGGPQMPPPQYKRHSGLGDRLQNVFQSVDSFRTGLDLLHGLLCYDPSRRLTVQAAIQHPYFHRCNPKPATFMPTFRDEHHKYKALRE